MRILDRYIVRAFLKNYAISFAALVGLYVVLDMVFNFDELVQKGPQTSRGLDVLVDVAKNAADYYFYQIFLYFVHLSAIIPVVAVAFTLMRLSRNNELTAAMAAGVPLLRLAAPMILVALVLNVLLVADQELVIPRMIPKLIRKHDEVRDAEKNSFPIRAMQDENGALLVAGRFFPAQDPPTQKGVSIIQWGGKTPTSLTIADRAEWHADPSNPTRGQWTLIDGEKLIASPTGANLHLPASMYVSDISPEKIQLYRSGEFVEMLSTQRINELLASQTSYGRLDLVRTKHTRFTQPLVNVIMLLLAIATVMTREPQQLKAAAGKCLVLCGVCMASVFVCNQLAAQIPAGHTWDDAWPALMAWLPIFIFGPLAVWMLDRIRT